TAAPPVSAVPETRGVRPERIWLVEKSATHELWSNGLRVDTSLSVMGAPRAFRVFDRQRGLQPEVFTEPVGILFHTSESDVWPLDAGFNENLRDSTQKLLRYLRRNTTYHYLIDRFGRVWRVVDEGSKANHAGHSVWADGSRVFLNLNHAFLAVSFETRWEGGRALPITEAQFAAGRQLTDQLRQRHGISTEMAVAHGLTSVNPKKRLIGHHVDWARGFPFAAFGLADPYRVPSPAVALFGFSYDEEFLRVMQEPWPGVRLAEATLQREAAAAGLSPEALRRQRQELYDAWIADQVRADEARTSLAEDTAPSPGATED
ncbi:MAG: N-acetylmuramoyl-L-alanine amidase, partial [Vicinamibacteria bacterium]|nr:N-acetylmuramoyl-L-alanine amidase [Vicinamibacteria bacterium]